MSFDVHTPDENSEFAHEHNHNAEYNRSERILDYYCGACGYTAKEKEAIKTGRTCKVQNCKGEVYDIIVQCGRDGSHITRIARCKICGAVNYMPQ